LPLNAAIGSWEFGSPPVWSRDNPEGVSGTPPEAEGCEVGVSPPHWGVWKWSGRGLCPLPRFFFKFLSENGEFWCILGGTISYLLTHLLNFKRNRGNVQVNVRKGKRMRLSFLPQQLVRSSQQLVLKDTKRGFIRP